MTRPLDDTRLARMAAMKPIPFPEDMHPKLAVRLRELEPVLIATAKGVIATDDTPEEHRRRAKIYEADGLFWLAGFNIDFADAMERDARLLAIQFHDVSASVRGDGGLRYDLAQYRFALEAHLDAAEARQVEAA